MVKRRKMMGLCDQEQLDFISILLDGAYSVSHAAQVGGYSLSTVQKWLAKGHYVRAEFERRKAIRGDCEAALVGVLRDPKATPWSRSESARELLSRFGLDAAGMAEREKRTRERLEEMGTGRWDADEGTPDGLQAEPQVALADLPSDDETAPPRGE